MNKIWISFIVFDILVAIGYSDDEFDDPPITCPIPIIDNGIVIDNNNEELAIGGTLTVKCGVDYDISSIDSSVCQKDRNYSPTAPTCNAKPCSIPFIANGKTSATELVQPKQDINVICEEGYVISGSSTITCVTNAIYDPFNHPTCNAQNCKQDTKVENGEITGPTPYISPGSKVLIQCDQGYIENRVDIRCVTLDEFSFSSSADFSSVCVAQECVLPTITDGKLESSLGTSLVSNVQPGVTFQVRCNNQYTLNTASGDISCITLNNFSPDPLPQCIAQDCPVRPVTNGVCSQAKPGQPFSITCNTNYELATDQEFSCVSGSIYSPKEVDFPTLCKAKDCPLGAITNGNIKGDIPLKPGSTATLTCGQDYKLTGGSVITCVAGEKFENDLPRCDAFPCPVPDIVNGTIFIDNTEKSVGEDVAAGKELTIECKEPYALSTTSPISCVTKNVFNPNVLPTCIRDLCNKPAIANGQVTGPSVITPDSTLAIQCGTGYVMSHSNPVICYSRDKYNIDPPNCDAQNCARPEDSYITNGKFTAGQPDSIRPGKTYTIECGENYEISGDKIITCRSGTVFMGDYPRCTAKPCPKSDFDIPNGQISNGGSLIAVGALIKISCNTDYKKLGDPVTCKAGNEASGDLPTCTGFDCPSNGLPSVANGDYSAVNYSSGELIEVSCNTGYVEDTGTAKCETKSKFTGSLPSCSAQNCIFDKIDFGSITDSGNVIPGGRIEVLCNDGYLHSDITGTYTCVTHRTYNPPVLPSCEIVPCPRPSIANSEAPTTDTLQPGGVLAVTCQTNYKLIGASVTCLSGTKFSGSSPECQATDCDPVPLILNGDVDTTSARVKVGESVTVICDEHYKLSHTDLPICVTNEQYDPPLPSCNDKDCGIPQVSEGQVTGTSSSTVTSGTPLTIKCNLGYTLDEDLDKADGSVDGSATVKCVRNTIFNPELPQLKCVPQPCTTPSPDNAVVVVPAGMTKEVQPGSQVTVKCHSRYHVAQGIDELTIECVANTIFQPPVPTCQAKDCPVPVIANGSAGSQPITPGEPILVTCDSGYDISPSSGTVRCFALDAFSDDDGKTGDPVKVPTCIPRNCLLSLIPDVVNGKVTNTNTLTPGSAISITCDQGYDLSLSTLVTCTTRLDDRNLYSGDLPTCEPGDCPAPEIENASLRSNLFQPGKEVIYTCSSGFSPNDASPFFCVTYDQFSRDPSKCIENCIADNSLIPNGYISGPGTLKTGSEIRIECDDGFILVDPQELVTCETLKQYAPAQPAGCKAIPCPLPASIQRGTILNTGDVTVGGILLVTCPPSYDLSPDRDITCVSGDVYDPVISSVRCADKPCVLTADAVVNGVISPYVYQPKEKLQFSCNAGYVQDRADAWCETDTKWSPQLPTCNPQPCVVPSIQYATITPTTLLPDTKIVMSCSSGKVPSYDPLSPGDAIPSFHCVTLDQFSLSPLPTCEARACKVPPISDSNYDGTPEPLSPGESLVVVCDSNFTLELPEGLTSVTCESTKQWSSTDYQGNTLFPRCKARNCLKPIVKNGIISTLDVITPGSTLELNCGTGYVTPVVSTFKCVSYEIYEPETLPRCGTTNCVMPNNFEYGKVNGPISPGSKLQITCDEGYSLDCDTDFTCVTGDVFNPNSNLPQCKPKLCDSQQIQDGDITGPNPITPGSFLTIQCKAGKAITSHVMPKCVHTDLFNPPLLGMECVNAVNCTGFGDIEHGYLSSGTVSPGQYTSLLCDEGYSPVPSDGRVYCVVGGIANPHYPATFGCARTQCDIPSVQNGLVTNNKLFQGDTLQIKCQNGYFNPFTAAPVKCLKEDYYSTNPPFTCLPVKECVIPDVSNGEVLTSSLPIGSRVAITCDAGFYDPYNGDVRCTDVGTISHTNIACQVCDKTYSNTDGVIHSPMYESKAEYPPKTQCTYKILAQDDKHIKVSLDFMDLEKSEGCTKDALSFYDGDTVSQDTLLYSTCGSEGVKKRSVREITSSGSVLTVLFVSDSYGSGSGFAIGYAAFVPSGGTSAGVIAAIVIVPLVIIFILLILLFLYCRYYRTRDEPYSPHKNFHWKEGGPVDNNYFHFIANGGRKPPPTMATKLQATARLPDDETGSEASGNSRNYLTPNKQTLPPTVSYSSIKLGKSASNILSRIETPSYQASLRSSPSPSRNFIPPVSARAEVASSHASSNFHHAELDNLQKYNHKKALEGLGLSEADFKLNIPASYKKSDVSLTDSEDDSLTRTALEDTLLDGDPLQHTVLSDEVLRSPRTMKALEKFRAGAKKHESTSKDSTNENYEMKKQNRLVSQEQLANQRRAYEAGYRRPLPPSSNDV